MELNYPVDNHIDSEIKLNFTLTNIIILFIFISLFLLWKTEKNILNNVLLTLQCCCNECGLTLQEANKL